MGDEEIWNIFVKQARKSSRKLSKAKPSDLKVGDELNFVHPHWSLNWKSQPIVRYKITSVRENTDGGGGKIYFDLQCTMYGKAERQFNCCADDLIQFNPHWDTTGLDTIEWEGRSFEEKSCLESTASLIIYIFSPPDENSSMSPMLKKNTKKVSFFGAPSYR